MKRKPKKQLKKDFGSIVEYWRCWKLRKKVMLTLSFFPLMCFSPKFFHDTAKRRQNWVLYCGLVYKIVLVFTYTLTLLSSPPPPCIFTKVSNQNWVITKNSKISLTHKKHFYFIKVVCLDPNFLQNESKE